MLVKDNLPLQLTEKEGFKHFMKVLAPRYQLFHRGKTVTLIEEKYKSLSGVVKLKLKKAQNLALTADLWTDKTMQSFVGVTAHYLDIEMKSIVLGKRSFFF